MTGHVSHLHTLKSKKGCRFCDIHCDEEYLPSQASFYPIIVQINRLFSDPVSVHYLQHWSGSAQL